MIKKVSIILSMILIFSSCVKLKDVQQALINMKKLKFKIENIENFKLNNINIQNKSSISDFSMQDGMKLLQLYKSNKLPCDFTLNIAAINPNDGSTGSKSTNLTITKIKLNLYIDDKPTINGIISTPITIPSSGQKTIIPIGINLDLYDFFGNEGYEKVINLALALGGVEGSTSRVKIDITPENSQNLVGCSNISQREI